MKGTGVRIESEISNVDRAVGAMLSNRISQAYGGAGLPDDTIDVEFDGIAGQSFGAFLASGVTMRIEGACNDYVGKGLSGGKIVVRTPEEAAYAADENVLIGNVALYGATRGEAYINGVAGERFAVRNSGVKAVVEGVGDHGCEYMTGGVVAVLGETGTNFAAGMSGGVAYVYDPDGEFADRVNTEMVTLDGTLDDSDEAMLRRLVENHAEYTDSDRASWMLDEWAHVREQFVKVMPDAYAEVIAERARDDVRTDLPAEAGASSVEGDTEGVATTSDD
jgi:glutamate synthase (NADPH/NADH) large chain